MRRISSSIKIDQDGGFSKEVFQMRYAQLFPMRIGPQLKFIMSLCSMNNKGEKGMEQK